jgi:hypothetical protein
MKCFMLNLYMGLNYLLLDDAALLPEDEDLLMLLLEELLREGA